MTSIVYIHEKPKQTVLPYLKEYLPFANNPHYMIVNPPAKAPAALVIASFKPLECPPKNKPWAVATTDFSRKDEAEFWFWSSIEASEAIKDSKTIEASVANENKKLRLESYNLLESMVALIQRRRSEASLSIACLHTAFLEYVPGASILENYGTYTKFMWKKGEVPSEVKNGGYEVQTVKEEHIQLVVEKSTVKRTVETLRQYHSTGVYLDAEPVAWCWTARDGTLATLYVIESHREQGLAKLAMWNHLQLEFESREFVCADIDESNIGSVKACERLGAKKAYQAVWLKVDISEFFSTKVNLLPSSRVQKQALTASLIAG